MEIDQEAEPTSEDRNNIITALRDTWKRYQEELEKIDKETVQQSRVWLGRGAKASMHKCKNGINCVLRYYVFRHGNTPSQLSFK